METVSEFQNGATEIASIGCISRKLKLAELGKSFLGQLREEIRRVIVFALRANLVDQ